MREVVARERGSRRTGAAFEVHDNQRGNMRTVLGVGLVLALIGLPFVAHAETTLEIYGHADMSADYVNRDLGNIPSNYTCTAAAGDCVNTSPYLQISSNSSYLGFRITHDIGTTGMKGLVQFESGVDVSATADIKDSLGSRESYVGLGTGFGNFKIGKADSPYKKSTGSFDPFSFTVGDYNSIMGNTGGDNRAEFDWRFEHAVWWESPNWSGFKVSALYAPGQNRVTQFNTANNDNGRNSGTAEGEVVCTGANPYGSGTAIAGGTGGNIGGGSNACTDGSFGDAASVSASYLMGPMNLVAAYEIHYGVNRHGDDNTTNGTIVGVHDEWAYKVGGQFKSAGSALNVIYEDMQRDRGSESSKLDERSRDGYYLSGTQAIGDGKTIMAAWAHANKTPGDPVAARAEDNEANLYTVGYRQRLDESFSWYAVYAMQANNKGAHYDLGASGHGIPIVGRDGSANCDGADGCLPTDANGVVKATTIQSFSMGVTAYFSGMFKFGKLE
jgi:predicted porin